MLPYEFTLFASSIYGLSGVLNLILFLLTRPKVVVGHSVDPTKESAIYFRHDSPLDSPKRFDLDYGLHSDDIKKPCRPGSSSSEVQSPSRTVHRMRSSYDLQGINNFPSSPSTRNVHRWTSAEVPVLDIV